MNNVTSKYRKFFALSLPSVVPPKRKPFETTGWRMIWEAMAAMKVWEKMESRFTSLPSVHMLPRLTSTREGDLMNWTQWSHLCAEFMHQSPHFTCVMCKRDTSLRIIGSWAITRFLLSYSALRTTVFSTGRPLSSLAANCSCYSVLYRLIM